MTNQEAIRYLQQLYPNGGHCWLDEQRIEALGMAIDALQEEPASEDLEEAAFDYAETCKYEGVDKLLCVEHFKAGAKWGKNQAMAEIQAQSMALAHGCPKEEPISEDLEETTNNYGLNVRKGYPRVKDEIDIFICNAFKAGAKWQKEQFEKDYTNLCNGIATVKGLAVAMTYNKGVADTKEQMMKNIWKDAQGDDLPEYEREVVVFTQNFPDDAGIMMVAIGHRPTPEGYDGKSLTTGEVKHYTPKTYDKGGWNIPDVKYWLDVELPKEIEL